MKRILLLLLTLITLNATAQDVKIPKLNLDIDFKKITKFATIYGAINGGTSLSDVDVYSVTNGLETQTISTPYDYSVILGVRKIARMGYEPKEAFKTGKENSF